MNIKFSHAKNLRALIDTRDAKIAVIGQGYVGLPLALSVHEAGFDVTGVDLNPERVRAINAGEQVLSYMPQSRFADAVASGRFRASTDVSVVTQADVIVICVPTPLDPERNPNLSYVEAAAESLCPHLQPGQMVVLESTVWPGATRTVLRPILCRSGLTVGTDLFLGFSPEREDPGNAVHHTRNIPKVVGADDQASRELLQAFYGQFVETTVPVGSCDIAEAVKLVENSFRTVNIAYVNELKVALSAMGIDVWEVIAAAATKPFGYMPFYPGPGIGGDCIPVSPAYLSWRAKDVGSSLPMVDQARESSDRTPVIVADTTLAEIAARFGTAPSAARVLLVGISYKRDVEDTRISPSLLVLDRLERCGVTVDYHDAFFPEMPVTRDNPELAGRRSVALTPEAVAAYDAVLITTDHSDIDYAMLARQARLVCDSRNAFDSRGIEIDRDKLVKL